MKKIVVIGANSFSGQDFVDLLLDNQDYQVIGISRSPERSTLFLRYKMRPSLSRYHWEQIDLTLKNHFKKTLDFSILKNIPIGSGFEVINLNALEKSHRKGQRKHRSELASLYIYEHKQKFKIQELEPRKELQRPDLRLTVDNPEDLLVARIIQDEIGKNDSPIELKKIIKFLDKNPEVKKINSGIPVGKAKLW